MWLQVAMWCLLTSSYSALPQLHVEFNQTTKGASIACRLEDPRLDTEKLYDLNGYVILNRNQSQNWSTMAEIFKENPTLVHVYDPRIVLSEGSVIDSGQNGTKLKITLDTVQTTMDELFRCDAILKNKAHLHQQINQFEKKEPIFKISNFTMAAPAVLNLDKEAVSNKTLAVAETFDAANPHRKDNMKRPLQELTTSKEHFIKMEETAAIDRILPNEEREFRSNNDTYMSNRAKRSIDGLTTEPTETDLREAKNLDEFQNALESILPQLREMQQSLKAEDRMVNKDSDVLIIMQNMTDQLRQAKQNTLRALHLISLFYYYKNGFLEKKIAFLESRENSVLNYSHEIMSDLKEIPSRIYSSLNDSDFEWPQGTYALIKSSSGCPLHHMLKWEEGFYKFKTANGHSQNADSYSENSHLVIPVKIHKGFFQFMNISFCVKDNIQDRERPWPKGSYCINRKDDCPEGFSNGSIYIDESRYNCSDCIFGALPDLLVNSTLSFCCRSDASPSLPIKLPPFAPFYLYRFNGTCQNVTDMISTEEYVHLDTYEYGSVNKDKLSFPHPDGRINNVNISLCYYEPLTFNLKIES